MAIYDPTECDTSERNIYLAFVPDGLEFRRPNGDVLLKLDPEQAIKATDLMAKHVLKVIDLAAEMEDATFQ